VRISADPSSGVGRLSPEQRTVYPPAQPPFFTPRTPVIIRHQSILIMLTRPLTRSTLARSCSNSIVAQRSAALLRSFQTPPPAPTASPASRVPANKSARSPFGVRSFSTTMSAHAIPAPAADNSKPAVDKVVQDIADYVHDYGITSPLAVRLLVTA